MPLTISATNATAHLQKFNQFLLLLADTIKNADETNNSASQAAAQKLTSYKLMLNSTFGGNVYSSEQLKKYDNVDSQYQKLKHAYYDTDSITKDCFLTIACSKENTSPKSPIHISIYIESQTLRDIIGHDSERKGVLSIPISPLFSKGHIELHQNFTASLMTAAYNLCQDLIAQPELAAELFNSRSQNDMPLTMAHFLELDEKDHLAPNATANTAKTLIFALSQINYFKP